MKEQVLLYGVCAAISVIAVAVTSLVKIIVCAIAKRCGKSLSGNVKEYIFTPIALLLAAGALYVWLDRFMCIEDEQIFILIIACFSVGTMLVYWLLFQPTRKAAVGVIKAIIRYFHVEPVAETVQEILLPKEDLAKEEQETERAASESHDEEDPLKITTEPAAEKTDNEADKLRAMVEAIKKN